MERADAAPSVFIFDMFLRIQHKDSSTERGAELKSSLNEDEDKDALTIGFFICVVSSDRELHKIPANDLYPEDKELDVRCKMRCVRMEA
jgi:hypothetical protein